MGRSELEGQVAEAEARFHALYYGGADEAACEAALAEFDRLDEELLALGEGADEGAAGGAQGQPVETGPLFAARGGPEGGAESA